MKDKSSSLESSIQYLSSDEAMKSLRADCYWPKWNSPWWHMLLIHELGETKQIPKPTIEAMIAALNAMPIHTFPLRLEDIPPGTDVYRHISCTCAVGNIYQVLSAWGVNVDQEVSWLRPWLLEFQMPDGGLSCDRDAYHQTNECPSSMVATIAAFEAVLYCTPRRWTNNERLFLDRAAQFLIQRQLRLASTTQYNAEERDDESEWLQLCFPRFYFYDVLRGLNGLLDWSEKTKQHVPTEAFQRVVSHLKSVSQNGALLIARKSYKGVPTLIQSDSGEWKRIANGSTFPLLEMVSTVGIASPHLTKHWEKAQCQIQNLK